MANRNKLFLILLLAALISPFVSYAQVPQQLTTILNNVQAVAVAIGWSLLVIGFVIAGGLYLTSTGDLTRMGIAKKALIAAIIGGIILVLGAANNTLRNIITNLLSGQ